MIAIPSTRGAPDDTTWSMQRSLKSMVDEVDENGYCIVSGVLDADEVASVREALDRAAREDDVAGRASLYGPWSNRGSGRSSTAARSSSASGPILSHWPSCGLVWARTSS